MDGAKGRNPLTQPSATPSPSDAERAGVRGFLQFNQPASLVGIRPKMFLRLGILLLMLFGAATGSAHVGRQNIVFEGLAGPYPLRVVIKPPGVVPGLAEITVRCLSDEVESVSVLPMRWDAGRKGAPPPDPGEPVEGDPALFTAKLWLMNSGAYSVLVNAKGTRGEHSLLVPVNSVATQRLGLPTGFGAMLAALGLLLVALVVTIAGAAVRESTLPTGTVPDRRRRIRGVVAAAAFALLVGGGLVFGRAWWKQEENRYLSRVLYQPAPLRAEIKDGLLRVGFDPATGNQRDRTPLIPDHGKLMHLFMVRTDDAGAVAHLHPVRDAASGDFLSKVPPLSPGNYRLFADITQESGFAQTLVGSVELSDSAGASPFMPSDADDAFRVVAPASAATTALSPGLVLKRLEPGQVRVDEPVSLRFQVLDAEGQPKELEPYLGMFGHAFILKDDGTVFTHLHPQGNVSMGAGLAFTRRELGEGAAQKLVEDVCSPLGADHVLPFPYSFPAAGRYHVWVQVKVGGRIETGAFTLAVAE